MWDTVLSKQNFEVVHEVPVKTRQGITFLAMSIDDLTHLNFMFSEHKPYAYPVQQETTYVPHSWQKQI